MALISITQHRDKALSFVAPTVSPINTALLAIGIVGSTLAAHHLDLVNLESDDLVLFM
jgi:hypothetical protein